MTRTKEEILGNHRSVLWFFGNSTKDEEMNLPSLYWIPKLHKCPFKQAMLLDLPNAPRYLFPNY